MRAVKDKRIEVRGKRYLATCEFFRDMPARDNHTPATRICDSIGEAQDFLSQFPRDCFDGLEYKMSFTTFKTSTKRYKRRKKSQAA